MNSEEIKEEARKRIERMSLEEKKAAIGRTPENEDFINYVQKMGYENLPRDQRLKFAHMTLDQAEKAWVGGVNQAAEELSLKEEFGITRDEIKNMKKNPYKAGILRDVIISLVLHVGAAASIAAGMGYVAPVFELPAGLVALDFASRLIKYFKYKKIQKNYASGKLTEEEINAEIHHQLLEEYNKGRLK